ACWVVFYSLRTRSTSGSECFPVANVTATPFCACCYTPQISYCSMSLRTTWICGQRTSSLTLSPHISAPWLSSHTIATLSTSWLRGYLRSVPAGSRFIREITKTICGENRAARKRCKPQCPYLSQVSLVTAHRARRPLNPARNQSG